MINKVILRKESFGGIFIDNQEGKVVFLDNEEYKHKLIALNDISIENKVFFDVEQEGRQFLQNALSSPLVIYLELVKFTEKPNTNGVIQNGLSLKEITDIIEQFSSSGGYCVRIAGGEATKREDFFDIVDLIHSKGLRIGLNISGTWEDSKIVKIVGSGIKDIRISLEGPEEFHDSIKGRGNYNSIQRSLDFIKEHNKLISNNQEKVSLMLGMRLMKSNRKYVKNMINLSRFYECKLDLGLMKPYGTMTQKCSNEILSPSEIIETSREIAEIRKSLNILPSMIKMQFDVFKPDEKAKLNKPSFLRSKCLSGTQSLTLDFYGNIFLCGYFINIGGQFSDIQNIRSGSLLDIWYDNRMLNEYRNAKQDNCKNCQFWKTKCNGGCPFMAYLAHRDIDSQDPYCVKF